METNKSSIAKKLGIAATLVSLTGGTVALWNQFSPDEKLPELTGSWTIDVVIEDSGTHAYKGHTYQFEIGVDQDGAKLKGAGKQTKYRGKKAPKGWKFEILGGKVEADSVIISYMVHSEETYTGSLRLGYDENDARALQGQFTSSVDDQFGSATVRVR